MSSQFKPTTLWLVSFVLGAFNTVVVLSSQDRNCASIYVQIQDFGEANIDRDNWNGVYPLDTSQTSFNASVWRINANKWLKYIQSHWVLSGTNKELFIYESDTLFPPVNATTTWIHEFYSDSASIHLYCSSTSSPTASPSPAPTDLPTFSPTPKQCDVLIVSDVSEDKNDTLFNHWLYERLPHHDWRGSPIWQYEDGNMDSNVQHLPQDGWSVFLNEGKTITTYTTGHLNGYYPPLNTPYLFDLTSSGRGRTFTFVCQATNHPTTTPSTAPTPAPTSVPIATPTPAPTSSPIGGETVSPTSAPTFSPTIAPSMDCEVLSIEIQNDATTHDQIHPMNRHGCGISFEDVFDHVFWLQQEIYQSNRPTWTLDCDDNNEIYTNACSRGYSGSIFYISNQWEIQIHSRNDRCLERFIVQDTGAYFVPIASFWTRQSTQHQYQFIMNCLDKIQMEELDEDNNSGSLTNKTVYIYENTFFWLSLALVALLCVFGCFMLYCWKQKQKPIVVYQPHAVKSISVFSVHSPQSVELGQVPNASYADHAVALQAVEGTGHKEELSSSDDDIVTSSPEPRVTVGDGDDKYGGTASDPRMNPNLKPSVSGDGDKVTEMMEESDSDSDSDVANENLYGRGKRSATRGGGKKGQGLPKPIASHDSDSDSNSDGKVLQSSLGGNASDPNMNPHLKPRDAKDGVRGTAGDPKINPNLKPNVGDGASSTKGDSSFDGRVLVLNASITMNPEDSVQDNEDEVIAGNRNLVPAGYHHVVDDQDEDGDDGTGEEEFIIGV